MGEETKTITESFMFSDFCRKTTKPSNLIEGLRVTDKDLFICPSCHSERARPEHGEKWGCECGLFFIVHGNILKISKVVEA